MLPSMRNIEQYLQDITNPDKTGLPAIIAITKLNRALEKGAVIPDDYAHVNDIFLTQKRADCLQSMGVDAWEKSQDENRDFGDRLELLEAIEGYKNKGDFGWQVFGITERDFYWQKTVLQVSEFNQGFDNEADYYDGRFEQKFESKLRRLASETMLSDEDLDAVSDMCSQAKDAKYAEMKTASIAEFERLSEKANDETVPFDERIQALSDAERQIGNFYRTASDAEKQKSRDMDTKRDALFTGHFKSRHDEAIAGDNALQSYNALDKLNEGARNESFELDEVLGIEWPAFYRQQEQFLYDAASELIEMTNKMVDEGKSSEAYYEFSEYFSSRMKSLEDAGHNITKIRDHSLKLLKIKTKSEFDLALAQRDTFNKANQLGAFAPGGHMSGHALDNLFGEDRANKMRGIAKNAFIDVVKEALSKYEIEGDETELARADYVRADRFLEWSDITDDVEALQVTVERNGHQLRM